MSNNQFTERRKPLFPSVRPSVTPLCSNETAKHIIKWLSPSAVSFSYPKKYWVILTRVLNTNKNKNRYFRFLPRGLCRHACVCLCVCVCMSVTFVNCVKTNKRIIKIFSPSGRTIILVFFLPNGTTIFRQGPPNGGVDCRWGRQKSRF